MAAKKSKPLERIVYTVGGKMTVRGRPSTIIRVWPLGTVDVQDDDNGQCYRVTGLRMFA